MTVANVLKGHDLFQSLSVDEVDKVSGFSHVKTHDEGATIFEEGMPTSHLFILLEGKVHLRFPIRGPELGIVVSTIEKGEIFGLSPLLGGSAYTATAQCATRVDVLALEAAPFREMLQDNCVTGFYLMNKVAEVCYGRYMAVLKNLQDVVSQVPLIR